MGIFNKKKELEIKVVKADEESIKELKELLKKSKEDDKRKSEIVFHADRTDVITCRSTPEEDVDAIGCGARAMLFHIEQVILHGTVLQEIFDVSGKSVGNFIEDAMSYLADKYDELSPLELKAAVTQATVIDDVVLETLYEIKKGKEESGDAHCEYVAKDPAEEELGVTEVEKDEAENE